MSHTIITTSTTTSSSDSGFVSAGYARSVQGMLKIAQVVVLLIAFLCVHISKPTTLTEYSYFEVVTVWFLVVFLIFFIMHIFRLQPKMPCINWTLTEFVHYVIGTILILIASIVVIVKSYGISGLVAGAVFGFIATFLLALNIWMSYKITCGSQPTGAAV
ncbi:CKLF-like MARVEL transmembrane domain-containing protein 7 [Amia ocellicauda]|uniref:CKLF-like MARVEL transmembrane domain-containing protein 7 n=1 Tax=Amia ocellicauda TaxID=2972642 RepID=UPI0034643C2A